MSVHVIQNLEDWETQRAAWEEIYQSNKNHTPYQSFEWLTSWWRNLGDGKLYLLRVDDPSGEALGFAPFFKGGKYYRWPFKHLAFIGSRRTDYLDFLVRAGEEHKFFGELFQFLRNQRDFGFVKLGDLPDTSSNLPFLLQAAVRFFPIATIEHESTCVSISLPDKWEDFVSYLGKKTRRDLAYDRRFLMKHFTVDFKEFGDEAQIEVGQRDLMAVYDERWKKRNGFSSDKSDLVSRFEAETRKLLAHRRGARIWMLYLNGEPVAGLSGYLRDQKIFADTFAHSPRCSKFSVGNVLLGMVIEKCIAEGLVELDLSRGEESYKYRWGGREKRNLHIVLFMSFGRMVCAHLWKYIYLGVARSSLTQKMRRLLGAIAGINVVPLVTFDLIEELTLASNLAL